MSSMQNLDTQPSSAAADVCIVGAGPAGLAVARALKAKGIDYDQFERHSRAGGIWDIENPGTPMYESAHFISSRYTGGYYGFPMPDSFPDYPSRTQILSYTEAFADAYGLTGGITFGMPVRDVAPDGDGWIVTTGDGQERRYAYVVCASGHTWEGRLPDYPGTFSGKEMHSVEFRSPTIFEGKRVLVVGAGNSACDIACDAARSADAAFISMRRGYHFVPKHILGKPADVFANSAKWIPPKLSRKIFAILLRTLNGDLTKYGLQAPDHGLLESHPILNSQLIHYLQHGDIQARVDIERLDGEHVVFKDGARERIDTIIYATGYNYSIPYADKALFEWKGSKPSLNYTVFNPLHDGLFAIGFTEMNAGGYYIFDEMASLIANGIELQSRDPAGWETAKTVIEKPVDMSGGLTFVQSDRHIDYLDMDAFKANCAKLADRLGWERARKAQPPTTSAQTVPLHLAA